MAELTKPRGRRPSDFVAKTHSENFPNRSAQTESLFGATTEKPLGIDGVAQVTEVKISRSRFSGRLLSPILLAAIPMLGLTSWLYFYSFQQQSEIRNELQKNTIAYQILNIENQKLQDRLKQIEKAFVESCNDSYDPHPLCKNYRVNNSRRYAIPN